MLTSPGLYLVTSPSNREYIGMTLSSFNHRYHEHLRHSNLDTLVGKAFRKYGRNMVMKPLVVCKGREALYEMERTAFIVFDTAAPVGYNLSPGGGTHKFELMACTYCGEVFEGRVGVSKYCCPSHKSSARRRSEVDSETRICERCGNPFTVNKYDTAKFCGRSCANRGTHKPHKWRSF